MQITARLTKLNPTKMIWGSELLADWQALDHL